MCTLDKVILHVEIIENYTSSSQQMAFTRSPSLRNNPKILDNYLIFTENYTSNVWLKRPETSVSSLQWAHNRNGVGIADLFFSSSLSIKFPPIIWLLGGGRLGVGVGGTETDGDLFRPFLFFKFKHQVSSHLLNIGPRAAGSGRDRNRWGPALTSQSRVSVRQDSSLDSYLQNSAHVFIT